MPQPATPTLKKINNIQAIQQAGQLRIAVYPDPESPFVFLDKQHHLSGFDVLLAKAIARDLHVKANFLQQKNFDDVVNAVALGNADVGLSDLSITLERALKVNFTKPYYHQELIIIRSRLSRIATIHDSELLNNPQNRLGVMANAAYADFGHAIFPNSPIIEAKTFAELIDKLRHKQIDYILINKSIAKSWFYSHPASALYFSQLKLHNYHDMIGIAVNYNNRALRNWINIYLTLASMNHNLLELKKYYLESNQWHEKV